MFGGDGDHRKDVIDLAFPRLTRARGSTGRGLRRPDYD